MVVKKILFLGDSHVQGVGTEWPSLYKSLRKVPSELTQGKWTNFIRQNKEDSSIVRKKYLKLTSNIRFDFEKDQAVLDSRKKFSWGSLVCQWYDKQYFNDAFDAKSNFHIANYLTRGWSFEEANPFQETLVILGVTDAINDITYHQPYKTQAFKNITIPSLAFTINYIKEFVTSRGGKFCYFHVNDFPEELYDVKLNPFYYNISPYLLFDRGLHSFLTPSQEWRKWDGKHYDVSVQKFLSGILIKELDNSDIIRILRED